MNVNRYDYTISEDFMTYEFFSVGPRGRIKKMVKFSIMTHIGRKFFNLAFGDFDEGSGLLNDKVVSNNSDVEKILATVARSVIVFTDKYPDALIYAVGSTASRTRRYQMGINKYWKEIESLFEVFGLVENEGYEFFKYGRNYTAFVAIRKKS